MVGGCNARVVVDSFNLLHLLALAIITATISGQAFLSFALAVPFPHFRAGCGSMSEGGDDGHGDDDGVDNDDDDDDDVAMG